MKRRIRSWEKNWSKYGNPEIPEPRPVKDFDHEAIEYLVNYALSSGSYALVKSIYDNKWAKTADYKYYFYNGRDVECVPPTDKKKIKELIVRLAIRHKYLYAKGVVYYFDCEHKKWCERMPTGEEDSNARRF